MDFGITFPSYIHAYRDAELAEANGFTHAWFYDSQLLYSDVYATMALVAEHTERLVLGTLVAIPSNRIAPVTASAVASLNALAPGRIVLGLGTGFTGRNTMGLPAVPLRELASYARQVRGLLAGEDVLYREGDAERWIRLLHPERSRGFLNLDDPIPIHIAANGPRALRVAGEVGEGWITTFQPPDALARGHAAIAAASGREVRPYTTVLTTSCVLRPGEDVRSARVLQRVGPVAAVAPHAIWESQRGGVGLGMRDEAVARAYGEYVEKLAAERGSPPDRRYLDVHEGHMVYLKPGEEAFVSEAAVRATLTGPADELVERLRALEAAGVSNVGVQVVGSDGRELIEEFGREVIARY